MAWFSGVSLGNLGDLGDIAGSLNKLGEQAASVMNIEKGFDIEDFLTAKEGADGSSKDQSQPAAAAAPLGSSLWDTALSQVPKESSSAFSGLQKEAKEGVDSFIPIPIPSLFGGQFSGASTPEPSPQKTKDPRKAEAQHTQEQQPILASEDIPVSQALNGRLHIQESVEEPPPETKQEARELQVEGWAIEDDVIVPDGQEEAPVISQVAGVEESTVRTEQPQEQESRQGGKAEPAVLSAPEIEATGQDSSPADIKEEIKQEEVAAVHHLHDTGDASEAAEELHGGWMEEEIEIPLTPGTPQESSLELLRPEKREDPVQSSPVEISPSEISREDQRSNRDEASVIAESKQEVQDPSQPGLSSSEQPSALPKPPAIHPSPAPIELPDQGQPIQQVGAQESSSPKVGPDSAAAAEDTHAREVEGPAPVPVTVESSEQEPSTTAGGSSGVPMVGVKVEEEEQVQTSSEEAQLMLEGRENSVHVVSITTTTTSSTGIEVAQEGAGAMPTGDGSTEAALPNGIPEKESTPAEADSPRLSAIKTSRSADSASSAAHAALEAALAVSSPTGPGSPVHGVGAAESGEMAALKEQLRSMEVALQNAARQAQTKADELAATMQVNDELKAQLAEERAKNNNDAELEALREEYQHRLGAAERKVYALTKERDMLRREQNRKSDTSTLLKEKDEIIKQVMAEGEELSKKQAAQEAAMKKLRTQLREVEEEKQRLASRLQVEEARVESIRKDKATTEKALQDAVERSQAELAAQKDFYHNALAQAKEALLQAEAKADVEARADIERKIKESGERERVLMMSVEELRQALTRAEQQAGFREQLLRKDLEDMEARCQAAEARHEELVARMPDSTRPLLRQIEALQESTNMRVEALTGVERALNSRLTEAEAKAAAAEERERASTERLTQTLSRLAVMEAQLSCLRAEQAQLTRTLEKERHRAAENRAEYLAAQEAAAAADMRVKQLEGEVKEVKAKFRKDMQEEKAKREAVEQELESERALHAEYERKLKMEGKSTSDRTSSVSLLGQNQQQPAMAADPLPSVLTALRRHPSSSSSGSIQGEASILAASLTDSLAAMAAGGYQGTGTPRSGSFIGNVAPAAAFDQVEAMLRQKEGEISTYMARVTSLESTRDSLAEELVKSTAQVENLKAEVASLPRLKAELDALRTRHAAALELMGERDEQVEELRADLQDVKQMYREQIDLLVRQIEQLGSSFVAPPP